MNTVENRCATFLPLHLGHTIRPLSCSENVMATLNFFPQAIQAYSYVGMFPLLSSGKSPMLCDKYSRIGTKEGEFLQESCGAFHSRDDLVDWSGASAM